MSLGFAGLEIWAAQGSGPRVDGCDNPIKT